MDRFGAGTVTLVNDELLVLTEKGELICAPADASGFKPKARARFYHQVCVGISRDRRRKALCLKQRQARFTSS